MLVCCVFRPAFGCCMLLFGWIVKRTLLWKLLRKLLLCLPKITLQCFCPCREFLSILGSWICRIWTVSIQGCGVDHLIEFLIPCLSTPEKLFPVLLTVIKKWNLNFGSYKGASIAATKLLLQQQMRRGFGSHFGRLLWRPQKKRRNRKNRKRLLRRLLRRFLLRRPTIEDGAPQLKRFYTVPVMWRRQIHKNLSF